MKKCLLAVLTICSVLLFGCREKHDFLNRTMFAMDTVITLSAENLSDYRADMIESYIRECEEIFSKTVTNSEISVLNEKRTALLSPTAARVVSESLEISKNTDGAFDICAGALSDLWDITSGNNIIPDEKSIQNAKETCGYEKISFSDYTAKLENNGTLVDLGGVVKGFCAGICLDLLEEYKCENACVSLGGNVAVKGSSKNNMDNGKTGWNVGIKNPDDVSGIIGYLNLTDTTVAVSGDYERYFEKDGKRYHHIFDTSTGFPSDSGLRSVAVVSRDGLVADALSTALFVMGKDRAQEFIKKGIYDFECVLVSHDGTVYMTKPLYDVFTPEPYAKNGDGVEYTYEILAD